MKQLPDTSQNFIGVWLDPNSEKTDNEIYVGLKQDLENTFHSLRIFDKPFPCISYIHATPNSKILFISSLKYASNVMALMKDENLPQIHSMYLFCPNELEKDGWNSEDFKEFPIQGVFVCKEELMQKLKDDINTISTNNEISQTTMGLSSTNDIANEHITNAIPKISVFSSKSINNSIKNLDPNLIWYIRYQLLLEILLKLEKSKTEAKEMIDKCKELCENDKFRIKQIEEFKEEFEKDAENACDPIYWYTKDSFIFHLLNRVCGSENVDDIYPFRWFIRNLHNEIVKIDVDRRRKIPRDQKTVFRGKFLAQSTFKKLEDNKNGLVVMNGFLSTTEHEVVAKGFASGVPNSDQKAVIFELNIDSDVVNKPYAKIPSERHQKKSNEEEVLFSIGSVWQIINVKELEDNTKLVSLALILIKENFQYSQISPSCML